MNILIPMDLSEVSLNAFAYATERFPNASYTVLHSISGLLYAKLPYLEKPGVTQEMHIFQELESKILGVLNVNKLPENVNIEVYYGEPVNVITSYLKDHEFDAVVIGSRDNYNLLDKIIGTTSLGIIKRAKEPVYMVPRYASFKEYEKIMVASDHHVNDPNIISAIDQWNHTNAQIKFLHVSEGTGETHKQTKEALLKKLYEEYQPPFSYEIEEVQSKNIVSSILSNAYSYQANLLIVIARNKSFIHSLLFKSISKEIIHKSAVPVLFLHTSED